MKTKAKPRKSKARQLSLFDAKPAPKPLARWKQPRLKPSEVPNWHYSFYPPAHENIPLRRRVLGW
jgi:hypothetical protein